MQPLDVTSPSEPCRLVNLVWTVVLTCGLMLLTMDRVRAHVSDVAVVMLSIKALTSTSMGGG